MSSSSRSIDGVCAAVAHVLGEVLDGVVVLVVVAELVAGIMCYFVGMAHHKRKRPKQRRAGCLLCKPHKLSAVKKADRRRDRHDAFSTNLPIGVAAMADQAPRRIKSRFKSLEEFSDWMNTYAAPAREDDTPVLMGQTGHRRRATREELMALVEEQRARYGWPTESGDESTLDPDG